MAHIKYRYFAKLAREMGDEDTARTFEETADQEVMHAFGHLDLLYPKASMTPAKALQIAIDGETYEYTEMYPGFRATAEAEGHAAAVAEMDEQIDESKVHAAAVQGHAGKSAKALCRAGQGGRAPRQPLQGPTGQSDGLSSHRCLFYSSLRHIHLTLNYWKNHHENLSFASFAASSTTRPLAAPKTALRPAPTGPTCPRAGPARTAASPRPTLRLLKSKHGARSSSLARAWPAGPRRANSASWTPPRRCC